MKAREFIEKLQGNDIDKELKFVIEDKNAEYPDLTTSKFYIKENDKRIAIFL